MKQGHPAIKGLLCELISLSINYLFHLVAHLSQIASTICSSNPWFSEPDLIHLPRPPSLLLMSFH